jgi:TP901 family phage tail tape measure protein
VSDVNANINISINSKQALGQLRALQSQISDFNRSVIASNATAAGQQKALTAQLLAQVGASKAFSTSITNVESSVSRLDKAISKNKLSLGQYFRYATAASGTFGRGMREHAEIMELAGDRVKRLQTQYVALSQTQNGMTKAMAMRPLQLHNADAAVGIQRQQLFNKLMHDGSTSMVNWGKNTQWAGRQLMVGFTVPLTIFGGVAGKIFMDLEKQIVQFKRVYGDLQTTPLEKAGMVEQVKQLGIEFTKYGIAVNDTIALAAKAAATGATGKDLIAQTTEATRLATLGQIDYQQALDATISLQTAFGISSKDLAETTDFLNAVENQTVTSLDDITSAIPLVAPVIKGLGGDVKDLAIFMTAMREGGVSANEGANALKSGLASLINPTKAAREQLEKVGINIDTILSKNKGDLRGLVTEFGSALGELGKFERQQTLAKMFGKYQFARLGALFNNISKEGTQASRVIDLTTESTKALAALSEGELGQLEEAVGVKFTAAVEKLKVAIAPIGEAFLKIATPIIEFATTLADKFNALPDGMKSFITWGVAIGGVVIPAVVMIVGLFANFLGQMIKMGNTMRMFMQRVRGGGSALQYLESEELDAMAASASLEGQTNSLTGALNVQRAAVNNLARAYGSYVAGANAAAGALPQGFRAPTGGSRRRRGYATGGFVAGSGNKDTEPALLTPGEFVVNADQSKKFAPILAAINEGKFGMYAQGRDPFNVSVAGKSRTVDLGIDFASQRTWVAMQARLQSAADQGENVLEGVIRALRGTLTETVTNIEQVNAALRSEFKSVLPSSAREARYSRPAGLPPVRDQLAQTMGADAAAKHLIAAEGSARAAAHAMERFGLTAGQLEEATSVARAHTTAVDKSAPDAFDPKHWQAQSQVENQLTNLLATNERNQTTYLKYMNEVLGDTEMAQSLQTKITQNLSLTEQEYDAQRLVLKKMLADMETGKLSRGAVTGNFERYAVGSVAAVDWRRQAGVAYEEASGVGSSAIKGLKTGSGSHSDSVLAGKVGDDVVNGFVHRIEAGEPRARAAGADLVNSAEAGMSQSESTGRRGRRGASRPAGAPNYRNGVRLESAPQNPTGGGLTGRYTPATMPATNNPELPINSKTAKETDGRLKDFGGKLMGGMFALDGLVFGLSMLDNSVGDMAQKIMPAVFGLQAVAMMKPLLMTPMGALIGAIAAVGIGLWKINDNFNEVSQKGKDLADAMTVSAEAIRATADFYGRKTIEDKKFEDQRKSETGVTSAAAKKAQEYLTSDFGKKILSETEAAMSQVGQGQAVAGLANKLSRMVIAGAINPKQANAIATAVSESMGSETFDIQVIGKLNELIGPNGQDILTSSIDIAMNLSDESKDQVDVFAESIQTSIDRVYKQINSQTGGEGSMTGFAAMGLAMSETGIPGLSWLGERMANTNEDIAQLTISAEAFGKSVGNVAKSDFQLLSDAIARNKQYMDQLPKSVDADKRKQIRRVQIKEEDELRKKILENQKASQEAFERLQGSNRTATEATIRGMSAAVSETFKDPMLKSLSEGIFGRAGAISQEVQFNVGMKLSSGMINPFAFEQLLTAMGNDEAAFATLDVLVNNVGMDDANDIISQLAALDDEALQKEIDIVLDNRTAKGIEILTKGLEGINGLPDNIRKSITAETMGEQDVTRIGRAVKQFDELPNKKKKSRSVEYWHENFNMVKAAAEYFASLSPSQRKDYLITYTVLFDEQGNLSPAGWAAINEDLGARGVPTHLTGGIGNSQTESKNYALDLAKGSVTKKKTSTTQTTGTDTSGTGGSGGGGGSEEKSWLEQRIDDMKANARLYETASAWAKKLNDVRGAFFGRIQQFRSGTRVGAKGKVSGGYSRVPEQLIEEIGAGPEGLKRLQELLGLSKKKFNEFIRDWKDELSSKTVETLRSQITTAQRAKKASALLVGQGFTKEVADELSQDAGITETLIRLTKVGGKALKEFIELLKKSEELKNKEAEDPFAKLEEEWKKYSDAMNAGFDYQESVLEKRNDKENARLQDSIDANEKLIEIQKAIVDSKQDAIDANSRLNDLDQQAIDDQNRILALEQEKIDDLNREDELRQRTASALSRELELMSRQEQKIQDAYQKRIDALDEVAKLNERIAQAQQDQLNIAKALSEGDVYAAAEAAAQMQANQVKFASDQTMAGLEQGRENAINGLTGSNGQTRAQIEAQIQSIQDQSYQTSLLIRDIEDYMYNIKETKIEPLEEKIYQRNLLNRALQNEIYTINLNNIQPLEDANTQLEKQIEINDKALKQALLQLTFAGMSRSEWDAAVASQEELAANIATDANALETARLAYQNIRENLEAAARAASALNVPSPSSGSQPAGGLPSGSTVTTSTGQQIIYGGMGLAFAVPKNAGGMIKKYSTGAVVGDGARDSVNALLTPGEFVVRKAAVEKYGQAMFEKINTGSFSVPKYSAGGSAMTMPDVSQGGSHANINAPVYNSYSVNVSASTNASPDDIARTVIAKIKTIESSNIRRINGY